MTLYRLGFFHKKTFIVTENSEKEIWDLILKFSDINYLKRKWEKRSEEEYSKVVTYIKQSYEYQKASKEVDISTKPLLIYYSFHNALKAILFMVNDKKPSDFHGLKSPKIKESFLDIIAEVNDGVFLDLCKIKNDNIVKGQNISIKQMYENFLDINSYYCDYFGFEENFISPKVDIFLDGDINIFIEKDPENYSKKFEGLELKTNALGEKYFYNSIITAKGYENIMHDWFSTKFEYKVVEDGIYYLNKNEKPISTITSIYGLIFILGNITRYSPDFFYKLTEGPEGKSQLLERTIGIANRVFPNLLLNLLYGVDIIFGKH